MEKPLGGYVRVSRVGDRAGRLVSPEDQTDRIMGYARAHGMNVEMAEPELDVSGGRASRPILDSLIARVERGELGGIIVAQLDRFSRLRIGDALRTIEHIESVGGRVVAVAEAFDEATPEGRMARSMFLSISQMQLDRYRDSFDRSKRRALEAGIYGAPVVPLGYKCTRRKDGGSGKLEVDKRSAEAVRRGFQARAEGKSWKVVAEILGRDASGARKIIQNPVYLGELRVGDLPPNQDAHPALVSRDVWEAAQLEHARPARSRKEPALLSGLVKCASCSRTMAATGNGYRCKALHGKVRCPEPASVSNRIDKLVEAGVEAKMKDIKATGVPSAENVDGAIAELDDAEAELAAYTTAVDAANVGAEAVAAGIRTRADAVEAARTRLGAIRAASGTHETTSLYADWPTMSTSEKRQLLRLAIGAVWVRPGKRDFANRIKVCDPIPTTVVRGRTTPIVEVDWDNLPVSVPVPGAQDS